MVGIKENFKVENVVVVGSGISGFTTASVLLDKYPQIKKLIIVGREIINDPAYTSLQHEFTSWAGGANHMSFAADDDYKQQERDLITYKKFMYLGRNFKNSGIRIMKNKLIMFKTSNTPWYIKDHACEGICTISDAELEYRGLDPNIYKGFEYLTCTITPYIYLGFLRNKLEKTEKVAIKKCPKTLFSFADVQDFVGFKPDLIVNCTGLGARSILSTYSCEKAEVEENIIPYKGQICVINKDLPFQLTVEDLPSDEYVCDYVKKIEGAYQFSHVFPRSDGYAIVGGISCPGVYDNTKYKDVSTKLIENITKFVPELVENGPIEIIFDYVALRPGRKGGVRLEYKKYDDYNVIHNYGIGGAGFQASVGLALEVSELVNINIMNNKSKL